MPEPVALHDLCEKIVDCPHSTPVWTDSGVVVLRSKNIRNGRLDLSEPSFTDEAHYQGRIKRAEPRAGDLVITREAPMGEVCIIPEALRCCLGQRMVLLRPDARKVDSRYLLFALQSPKVQHEIKVNEGTGSTVSNLRIPVLEKLPIDVPPIADQRAVADILGALDDKIELNRRMNGTLEAMAQALFKEWFVDGAKERAGERKAGELAQLIMGQSPKGDTYNDIGSGLPLLNGAGDFVNGFPEVTRYTTDPLRTSRAGDVVFTMRGTIGNLCIGDRDYAMGRCVSALRPKEMEALWPVYFAMERSLENLKSQALGSVITGLTKEDIAGVDVPMLQPKELEQFHAIVDPMMTRREANRNESRTLTALRDTLLPKLMRGEVRVKETQHS